MTELELYKFIHDNYVEWRWQKDDNDNEDVMIFPTFSLAEDLSNLLSSYFDSDFALEVGMREGYLSIWMSEICEYYDIEIGNIFPKK